MERCPTCRAKVREVSQCTRCGTDFTRLLNIEARAQWHLSQAIKHWVEAKEAESVQEIERSLQLKQDGLAQLMLDYLLDLRATRMQKDDKPAID
ncbi:MAG: hypothetical protein ACR2HF_08890 [Methylococcaceae bacterium]